MKWHIAVLAALLIVGCSKQEESYQPTFSPRGADAPREYIVGIYPLHNPKRLVELFGPIIDSLNNGIPQAQFRLEASRNYEEFEKKLYAGHFAFVLSNPYQAVRSLTYGYRVFGKMGNDELHRGIIVVRKDSGIRRMADLKGKRICYPAPTALAGTMMPQYYLQTHGIDVKRDIENVYVGSQESSIMNVLLGHADAGGTWTVPWNSFVQENPEMAAQLEVKWRTRPLPHNAWLVRGDVPAAVADRVGEALVGLDKTEEGRVMLGRLGITRFERATDGTYEAIRRYLKAFSETVRNIEY